VKYNIRPIHELTINVTYKFFNFTIICPSKKQYFNSKITRYIRRKITSIYPVLSYNRTLDKNVFKKIFGVFVGTSSVSPLWLN
jgi:hypothetical protein